MAGEKLGRTTTVQHEIDVEGSTPVRQQAYRLPEARKEVVKQELDKMLAQGIVQPSRSPWASPIVLFEKKDGNVRFCVDYRKLNQVSKFDAYPMPRVDEVLESVGSAQFISTLDLVRGYWQIPMSEQSQEKTAFATPYGLFEFCVMPFGLHNAPATFQRMMNEVLYDCREFSRAYIDDDIVYSSTWEEHLEHLRRVFTQLRQANLSLKLSKCQFGLKQVEYLGHVIGGGVILPNPRKLEAVHHYKRPETKTEVKSFLGLTGYYRKFVPQYATISTPLSNLLKKGKREKVEWTPECEQAFQTLKKKLGEPPVLIVPDFSRPFVVQTDASNVGIGAVLTQKGADDKEHPVAFASRKLKPRENYSVVEKECLAIVWALQFFYPYLYGQHFVVETDHQPLTWLQRMKNQNPRLARWALTLQPYKFDVRHRAGAQHKNADGLSRGPPSKILRGEECDGVTQP